MSIRVLIADDYAVVRTGLRVLLEAGPDLEIVGEADSGEEAVALALSLRPDVVLMDLMMPGIGGVAAARAIRGALADTQVVALTSIMEDKTVVAAIQAGAIGYLLKDIQIEDLRQAVKMAAAGKVALNPTATLFLTRELHRLVPREPLSEREIEVLDGLFAGQSNKEIAVELSLSVATVKSHVSHLFAKLGVTSRTEAAVYGARR